MNAIAGIIDAPNPSIGLWVNTEMEPAVFDEKEITIPKLVLKALIFHKE
jgi:hypothetical protein